MCAFFEPYCNKADRWNDSEINDLLMSESDPIPASLQICRVEGWLMCQVSMLSPGRPKSCMPDTAASIVALAAA